MPYIDNLRLMVIILVVTVHLAVTYSGFGSWYYIEGTNLDTLSTVWFKVYQSFQQGYFLSLLFLIAGFFAAESYDRKGFGRFTGDRFKRLVIPTLINMVAIMPFIEIVELGNKPTGFNLIDFLSGIGVMWFTAALFSFSLIYGLVRLMLRRPAPDSERMQLEPTFAMTVMLILAIAIFSFLIRISIGTDILNFQIPYFASYIVLFAFGIIAYKYNMFAKISYRTGKRWLISAIALDLFVWLAMVATAIKTGSMTPLEGGLIWQSWAFSLWESFAAVAMSIGLIAIFREKFNHQGKLVKTLSDNSFAVYMFHPMIITPVTLLFSTLTLYPIVKWLLLCVICVPLCFAATHFIFRRIPILKNVL